MSNYNQGNGMQKRLILMTVLVFVFFIAYEFLVLKPQKEERMAQAKIEQEKEQNAAPEVVSTNIETNQVNSANAPVVEDQTSKNIITTIKTAKNIIEIDNLGRVAQVTLMEEKYKDDHGNQIKLFKSNQLKPLEVRFSNRNVNNEAFKVDMIASSSNLDATSQKQELTLTQTLSNTVLTKKFIFYPDGHYDLEVSSTNNEQFFITNGFRPDVIADMYAVHGFMAKLSDDVLEVTEDKGLKNNKDLIGLKFISNFDRYYATVIYNFQKSLAITLMPDENNNPQAFIHANSGINFSGFMGPKNYKDLEALNKELIDVIDYGWFTFIAKPMFTLLQFIQSYVGNWGWTIVILTILVKLVLYPLSYKGMVSMQKLKELAPKMKEIQQKYKDDKQKQSMHMMELYKKHGANPMGGCLPLLLQIPVFFAIYRVLINAIELKGAEWILWIHDLAEMDPYFVLPILMGLTMFIQQKITPTAVQDELQKKIFQMLPIIFTFFFIWFPAGLTLYWFVNNLFTIAQQYTMNRIFERKRVAKAN
ncbi:membrane protein insertase YidC [Aliarcobacter lanthieri]|uniref:membrane protein insertase YidC n=1 Tax=Aliarcobacter lanthieri TaxID=1355374 RepID=UPI000478AEC8|nr:membrane protein insertase YidC [Aliarcobacter lanthieri]QKF58820.1 membrane protein insertase, YidC/Oxa1 family [Aliarcobacter lanthieri]